MQSGATEQSQDQLDATRQNQYLSDASTFDRGCYINDIRWHNVNLNTDNSNNAIGSDQTFKLKTFS